MVVARAKRCASISPRLAEPFVATCLPLWLMPTNFYEEVVLDITDSQPISAWVQECSPRWSVIKVHVPLEHQAGPNHCGAAVVTAILAYFDNLMFQNEVAERLGTDPETGTFHGRMTQLLQDELSDFRVREEHLTVESLKNYLDQGVPIVCFLQAWGEKADYKDEWNSGHAVVAIGYDEQNIVFMDPWVRGQYAYLPIEELETRWHYRSVDAGRDYKRFGIVVISQNGGPREVGGIHDPLVFIR